MERQLAVALSIFILCLSILLVSAETSFAYNRPAESLAIALLSSGLALLATSLVTSVFSKPANTEAQNEFIPLSESTSSLFGGLPSDPLDKIRKLTSAKLRETWLILALAIGALVARVELHRFLVKHINCSTLDGITFVPFIVSVYDYWTSRSAKSGASFRTGDSIQRKHFNYICPSALLIVVGLITQSLKGDWETSAICSLVTNEARSTLLLQILCSFLDSAIVVAAGKLANSSIRRPDGSVWQTTTTWGILLFGGGAAWLLGRVLMHIFPFGNGTLLLPPVLHSYVGDTVKQSVLFAFFFISASKSVSGVKILTLSFIFSISANYISLLSYLWTSTRSFASLSISGSLLSLALLHAAGYLYFRPNTISEPDGARLMSPVRWLRCLVILSFGTSLILTFIQKRSSIYHPIDVLMSNAKREHAHWIGQAGHSSNLEEAVKEYRKRYNQPPPPGFDAWYQYAADRSSVIIDDYDQIYHDLLPFRALAPKFLRELTTSMSSNKWNDVATIIIRGGVAEPQADIKPTHRWMIDGLVKMITPFVRHLPDMDIAFNINDECRVAVGWDKFQELNNTANSKPLVSDEQLSGDWSTNRSLSWALSGSNDQNTHTHFVDHSFQRIFGNIASSTCPAGSKARTEHIWDSSKLCVSCAEPHSLEQFLQQWTLSGELCHQPDLANLHGFFLGPGSFKISQNLVPVFSQSKIAGFNDILYPSAWNYVDKVEYKPSDENTDPPYLEKEPTTFWRGTTSEGSSENGQWKGMARQRLLHLANNHTSNHVSVLLPSTPPGGSPYAYKTMKGSEISKTLSLNTSIHIADRFARCGKTDCKVQKKEFGIASHVDFQEHWRYRFLYDMDGAGFSGRFLPFLQSHSLPFRTALFRQWFDRRITPWLHFVPQDVRLHDMWSTLAYFSGAKTINDNGEVVEVLMDPHDREGQLIAEKGREWAEQTLRKEDMEIYLFRLLLEWGRLTDDKREELGFKL